MASIHSFSPLGQLLRFSLRIMASTQLSKEICRVSLVKRRLSSTEVEKDQFVPLLAAAELAGDTVSEKQMRNSFKVTEICPFSEKIIRQRIGMEDEIAEQIEHQNKEYKRSVLISSISLSRQRL